MTLSTKGRYAVTAMLELTIRNQKGPVTLAEISEDQDISLSYLEQLFANLRKHGLVKGMRGPGGGYQLGKEPTEISVASIIMAVDEKVDVMKCKGEGNCHDGQKCITHNLWQSLSCQIYTFLDNISLQNLVDEHEETGTTEVLNQLG